MNNEHDRTQETIELDQPPLYQKPKTSLFLDSATDIQSGATNVLESQGQGTGYLNS